MTPTVTLSAVGWWIGAIELAVAAVALALLLRTRSGRRQPIIAVCALMMITGSSRLLRGKAPDEVLITVELVAAAAAIFWFVRLYRAQQAITKELRRQRQQSQR